MIELLDGPVVGKTLALRRAPMYLRIVRDRESAEVDALDQLEDTPQDGEEIFVYRIEPGTWGQVFVRPGGRYEMGRYRHVVIDAEPFRDGDTW